MATWLVATSVVVAPMRFANERSAAGGMASSLTATMYQVGNDFQAATPITSAKVDMDNGCCTACITSARAGSFHPADTRSCRGCGGRIGALTAQGRRQSLQVGDCHRECGVTASSKWRGHLVGKVDTDACVMVGPETQAIVSH